MKLHLIILGLFLIVYHIASFSQEIDWKTTSNWKLYNIHNQTGFRYPIDSLILLKSLRLDDTVMNKFLTSSAIWPKDKTSLWMGLFVTSFETAAKETRKLIISSYGGFFYDPASKRYYELPELERTAWYLFINDMAATLDSQ